MAKAPLNITLGLANLACDLLGRLLQRLGWRNWGGWLRHRHLVLPTRVMRHLDRALRVELLEWPLDRDGRPTGADGLMAALLEQARLEGLQPDPEDGILSAVRLQIAPEVARAVDRLIAAYLAGRTASAEITVALVSTAVSWWLFGAAAPGAMGLASPVAHAWTLHEAILSFPLGSDAGQVWYGLFGVDTPWTVTAATVAWLTALFAVAAAFAGLVADPVEWATGMHRRRLRRLVHAVGEALHGDTEARLAVRGHYLARLFDLLDLAQAVARGLT